ncbi:transporter [Sphingobium sp. C100]|nr:TolC family protein [Sphingobium sp. C100]ETI65154.1 transporter [Sphingobium sp. C100]
MIVSPRALSCVLNATLAVSLIGASAAKAQTATSPPQVATEPPFTLERALVLGGAGSPSLEAGAAGVQAATAGRAVASLRPNPEIVVETENVAGSGEYRGFRSAETTAGLALPIELGGKRSARVAVADAQIDRARIGAAIAVADLTLAITQSYNEAATAEHRLTVARDQARIAAEAFRVARVRVTAGAASPIEQQRADVLRINAEAAVERATRTAEVARANLARLIGQPVIGPLDTAWFDRIGGYGPVQLISAEGTLALAAAAADAQTASAQVRLARAQRIPDVTVSASARRLEATNDVAAVFGVSIPIPLFNNGNAAVAQAQAQQTQAEALRRLAILEAERSIATAQAELANAATTARTAGGPALTAATEAARIARIGYAGGKFGQLDLLEAERTLAQTRAEATDALAAYHDAEARLARLTAPATLSTELTPASARPATPGDIR